MTVLSIIIVSWNTRELLAASLDSIERHPPPTSYEILVVDNRSTDGSLEMLRARAGVTLVENERNVGFATANNQAIARASGRYVLLLNPDTEVRAGALAALIGALEDDPTVGASGPLTLNPDGSLQLSAYPEPTLPRELWRLLHLDRLYPYGIYPMARWPRVAAREVDALLGACLLIRGEALEQSGPLDEGYFMYSEEIDLCRRLRDAGWRLKWVPEAEIVHYGGQSTRQVSREMFIELYRAKLRYMRKHGGVGVGRAYKGILALATLVRLLGAAPSWLLRPRQRHETLAGTRNYLQLLRALPGW